MTVISIMVGGFFGAISRFYVSGRMNERFGLFFPVGTFFVNMIGSFLLGLLIGCHSVATTFYKLFGIGFLGSFTTYSTFMNELVQLHGREEKKEEGAYLIVSLLLGMIFALVGLWIGRLFFS
ncbi:fluoride efflux transporter CrcB [Fervidibacillus albus]|uniref:Fluoride-specific ion channel FluC n=1 Tax=Fervidibacillus albus TaxID=2980026 RepID=A0A9E8RX91_9BACI|nr:fluoride efflux transporter CrcB [Fervidibacillus albus]WAA11039.1 fluoride efflux transporter CrcB [Fervidibacillus albus]